MKHTKDDALKRDAVLANIAGWLRHLADDVTIPYFTNGAFKADCNEAADVLLTPPAAQPAPVQEPVAVVSGYYGGQCVVLPINPARLFNSGTAFYTAPQPVPVKTYHDGKPWPVAPKPWVGLTDEEIKKCWDSAGYTGIIPKGFARAIEAKLKEKNT